MVEVGETEEEMMGDMIGSFLQQKQDDGWHKVKLGLCGWGNESYLWIKLYGRAISFHVGD